MSRFLPPSKLVDAKVKLSIIGDGCVIKSGSSISNSVLGVRSLIGSDCIVESSMIMGADYYETLDECEFVPGCLPMGLGDGSIVRGAIIDKNARVGPRCQLINKGGVQEAMKEDQGFVIRDGIIVIVKDRCVCAWHAVQCHRAGIGSAVAAFMLPLPSVGACTGDAQRPYGFERIECIQRQDNSIGFNLNTVDSMPSRTPKKNEKCENCSQLF